MGSKLRHSSRRQKAGRSSSPQSKRASPAPRQQSVDFEALLEGFSNALAIVATAAHALTLARADLKPLPGHDIGEDVITLEHGIQALRNVYSELDLAIKEVQPEWEGSGGPEQAGEVRHDWRIPSRSRSTGRPVAQPCTEVHGRSRTSAEASGHGSFDRHGVDTGVGRWRFGVGSKQPPPAGVDTTTRPGSRAGFW